MLRGVSLCEVELVELTFAFMVTIEGAQIKLSWRDFDVEVSDLRKQAFGVN